MMSTNSTSVALLCTLINCARHSSPSTDRPSIEALKPALVAIPQHIPVSEPIAGQDEIPLDMRIVAVSDAFDFALRPRFEDNDIVLPLPSQQARSSEVSIDLLVIRQNNDEIVERQNAIFSWRTRGAELRFFLPRLAGGDYVAEIRTMRTEKSSVPVVEDRAQVSFHVDGDTPALAVQQFDYHFEIHRSLNDKVQLASFDASVLRTDPRLATALQNNRVTKITLDCWASSDGDSKYNLEISRRRCQWVRDNVLGTAPSNIKPTEIVEAAHGEDNPPNPEPVGGSLQQLELIRRQNRVVIIKVYTPD